MSQRKLLLADDSITIQKVVNLTFADEGIEVITVSDGNSAMERLAETAPDLVLADVNMPGLNGYELCEKIRATEHLKNTPVILLVGSFEPFDEEKAKTVGADDFLTKPFQSIRQLVNKVMELLNSSRNGESETAPELENANGVRNFDASREEYSNSDTPASENSGSLSNAGMDDEMIETLQSRGFQMDETTKFESRQVSEPEYEAANVIHHLNADDMRELSFTQTSENPSEDSPVELFENSSSVENASYETRREISGEHYSEQQHGEAENDAAETTASSTAESSDFPVFDLSGDDLLEIPFIEEDQLEPEAVEETAEKNVEAEPQNQTRTEEPQIEQITHETTETNTETNEDSYPQQTETVSDDIPSTEIAAVNEADVYSAQIPPEMIEAIAQRVIEKLCDRAVKAVAWEVVPEMADLIIKKMTEEKLKE